MTAQLPALSLNDYQKKAVATAVYGKAPLPALAYITLKLNGEAGECAELIGKMYRDDNGEMTPERRRKFIKEMGDCLWYLAAGAKEVGITLEEVAQANLDKLAQRVADGTVHGDGSDR